MSLKAQLWPSQDGVELGVYIREAMEAVGKPFAELSPEELAAALRTYETERSHRVAHIVAKSGKMGSMFMIMGYLVSALQHCAAHACKSFPCSCMLHAFK